MPRPVHPPSLRWLPDLRAPAPRLWWWLAYPLVVHLAVVLGQQRWIAAACLGLVALMCLALVPARYRLRSLVLIGSAFALVALAGRVALESVVYLPPVVMNAALLVVFGRTLSGDAVPLVTRFETLMNGEPDAAGQRYTRLVTWWWAAFFALMTLECTALALFAPAHIWSLFTNFLNYVAVAAMFLIEYQVRIRCLPDRAHPGFMAFCRELAAAVPRARSSAG